MLKQFTSMEYPSVAECNCKAPHNSHFKCECPCPRCKAWNRFPIGSLVDFKFRGKKYRGTVWGHDDYGRLQIETKTMVFVPMKKVKRG